MTSNGSGGAGRPAAVASEPEGRPDVHRLAVAALVGQGFEPVALDLVADAAGDIEVARDPVGAADPDRVALVLGDDPRSRRIGAGDPGLGAGGEAVARIADPDLRRLAA